MFPNIILSMLLGSVSYLWLEFLHNLLLGSGLGEQLRKPICTDVWRSLGQAGPEAGISPGNENVAFPSTDIQSGGDYWVRFTSQRKRAF